MPRRQRRRGHCAIARPSEVIYLHYHNTHDSKAGPARGTINGCAAFPSRGLLSMQASLPVGPGLKGKIEERAKELIPRPRPCFLPSACLSLLCRGLLPPVVPGYGGNRDQPCYSDPGLTCLALWHVPAAPTQPLPCSPELETAFQCDFLAPFPFPSSLHRQRETGSRQGPECRLL